MMQISVIRHAAPVVGSGMAPDSASLLGLLCACSGAVGESCVMAMLLQVLLLAKSSVTSTSVIPGLMMPLPRSEQAQLSALHERLSLAALETAEKTFNSHPVATQGSKQPISKQSMSIHNLQQLV